MEFCIKNLNFMNVFMYCNVYIYNFRIDKPTYDVLFQTCLSGSTLKNNLEQSDRELFVPMETHRAYQGPNILDSNPGSGQSCYLYFSCKKN